jgi:glycosyltransferase involved in cell wall biosynthesis
MEENISDEEIDAMIDASTKPLVTIGIPVFNDERFIYGAIKSALSQTYKNIEVIILDDASTDETSNICKIFKNKTRYIRNEKNMGIGYGRWKICQEAKGDYIAFVSADDLLSITFVEEMLQHAEPDKILYSAYLIMDAMGNVTKQYEPASFDAHDDFCVCCYEQALRQTMFVNFSCVLIPRMVFDKVNFRPEIRYGEDLDFLLRSMKYFCYKYVSMPLVKYRVHAGQTTTKEWEIIEDNNKKSFDDWLNFCRSGE